MIDIKPFSSVRPTRDKAYLVATRSYLTYSETELSDKLDNNPYTFLHVINPRDGRDLPFGKEKYRLVKEEFERFVEEGILKEDEQKCFYIYRQVKDANEYIGLIGAVSATDYDEGKIRKHENTITRREEMFTDYLEETGFNAEPVLLTYRDDIRLDSLFARYIFTRSEYEFTSTDRVLHQLWIVSEADDIELVKSVFAEQEALYIADGHHRCASSSLLSKRLNENGVEGENHNSFMAFLIGEEQMKVYDFNRLVKGMNNKSEKQIVEGLKENFLVEKENKSAGFKPEKIHEIGMYINGSWYKLVPRTGSFDPRDPIGHLDAEILSRSILEPLLGIVDLKADKRVGFLPGTEGVEGIEKAVDQGTYDIGFMLFPVTVEQIKRVADAGAIMPPKSTYIEPKLRSGLTIYKISDHV